MCIFVVVLFFSVARCASIHFRKPARRIIALFVGGFLADFVCTHPLRRAHYYAGCAQRIIFIEILDNSLQVFMGERFVVWARNDDGHST